MPLLHHRFYVLHTYADTRTCFSKVGVALCKLFRVTYMYFCIFLQQYSHMKLAHYKDTEYSYYSNGLIRCVSMQACRYVDGYANFYGCTWLCIICGQQGMTSGCGSQRTYVALAFVIHCTINGYV